MSENFIYCDTDGWIIDEEFHFLDGGDWILNYYPPQLQSMKEEGD